jgi:hypothetical protein
MATIETALLRGLGLRQGMSRDAGGDFDHPRIEEGHPLRRHVLYRIGAPEAAGGGPNPKADHHHRSSM